MVQVGTQAQFEPCSISGGLAFVQIREMPRKRKTTHLTKPAIAIKAWRDHYGWTQAQLEEAIGRSGGTVSGLESGGTRYTEAHIEALSKAFRCTPYAVLVGPPSPTDPESEIIAILPRLNAEQKRMVAGMVKSLLPADKKLKAV